MYVEGFEGRRSAWRGWPGPQGGAARGDGQGREGRLRRRPPRRREQHAGGRRQAETLAAAGRDGGAEQCRSEESAGGDGRVEEGVQSPAARGSDCQELRYDPDWERWPTLPQLARDLVAVEPQHTTLDEVALQWKLAWPVEDALRSGVAPAAAAAAAAAAPGSSPAAVEWPSASVEARR